MQKLSGLLLALLVDRCDLAALFVVGGCKQHDHPPHRN